MRFSATILLAILVAVAAFASVAAASHDCPFAAAAAGIMKSDETFIRAAFSKFQKDHVKLYGTAETSEMRYQFFRSNYLRALELNEKLNKQRGTTGLKAHGVTQFMDLSPAEMKQFTGYVRSAAELRQRYFDSAKGAKKNAGPTESDWTKVKGVTTAVRNQGQCGSCWAFSAVTAVEGALGFKYQNNTEDSYLSTQQVVDCDPVSHGCNGGDLPPAYDYLSSFGGSITEGEYPYKAADGKCTDFKHKVQVPVTGYEWVIPPCDRTDCAKQDEVLLSEKIAERGPAAICVAASNDWYTYSGPEAFSGSCDNDYYSLNHCITLEGLVRDSQGELAWLARNSWGADWGLGGFILLPYGSNSCGVADEAAFALVE